MAILVDADHSSHRGYCRNVRIIDNKTVGGILIRGNPAANNLVASNENRGAPAPLKNEANARLEGNKGYEVEA